MCPAKREGPAGGWLWQGFLRRACAFSENGFSPLRVCFLSKFLRNLSDFSSKTIRRLVTAVSLMTATRLTQVYQTLKPAPLSILQPGLLPSARRAPANLSPHPYCKFVRTVTVFQHEISYRGFCFRSKFREMQSSGGPLFSNRISRNPCQCQTRCRSSLRRYSLRRYLLVAAVLVAAG